MRFFRRRSKAIVGFAPGKSAELWTLCVQIIHTACDQIIHQCSCGFCISGRNCIDYEENIAAVNKLIAPGLETIYFRDENSGISSSLIAELSKYRKNFSGLVPHAVNELLLEYRAN